MSHASGQVRFPDGQVMYYEYNGTSDVVCNCLYHKKADMLKNWRNHPHNRCTCGHDEPVEIACNYADGIMWQGRACRLCRAVTDGYGMGTDDCREYVDGMPGWWVYPVSKGDEG